MEVGLTDEDEVPEIAEVAVSQPGDVWQLGPHRIACGDSRDGSLVRSPLAGTVPQLMVTDPPYGVEYDPEWRHRRGVNHSARTGKSVTTRSRIGPRPGPRFPGEIAYVCHGVLLLNHRRRKPDEKRLHDPRLAAAGYRRRRRTNCRFLI